MPTLVMSGKSPHKIADGQLKKKAWTFLEKLQEDDSTPGLHIEPIANAADPRVRTGRVDQFWRAVLFKLVGQGDTHYVFHGIWAHDEAIAVAKRVTLRQNPINGIPVIEDLGVSAAGAATAVAPGMPAPAPVVPPAPAVPAQAEPTEPEVPHLVGLGYRREDLVERLGVPEAVADAALAAPTVDDLISLAAEHEGWLGLVLVDLGAGESVDDVITRLDLTPQPTTGDADEDLVRSLQRPAARAQFAFIGDQAELRAVIEQGDFAAWRVFLHPEQRRYVEQTTTGPFRLAGGAGTGKTVVLLHRARALAARQPKSRILLTTYTKNLASALEDQVAQLDPALGRADLGQPGVHITGVDALAHAVLRTADGPGLAASVLAVLGESRSNPMGRTATERWQAVVHTAASVLPPELATASFLQGEYELVVLPHRIRDEAEYLRVRRQGRGTALDRARRRAIWRVIETYRAQARADGTLDFAEAAAIAAAYLAGEGGPQPRPVADHVLVDEGQDLDPVRWQMLRAAVAPGPDDLFIAEDSHQRIYGPRTVLGRWGIAIVGRSRRLTLNYRTTAQNLRYAIGLLDGQEWTDLEGEVETHGYRSARSGPEPEVVAVGGLADEVEAAVARVRTWLADGVQPDTVAVLVPDRRQRERIVAALTDAAVHAVGVDRERPPAGRVAVMTRHRAKGTEFSRVVLTDLGADPAWVDATMDEAERADAELREQSLLYVAASRARDELVVLRRGGSRRGSQR